MSTMTKLIHVTNIPSDMRHNLLEELNDNKNLWNENVERTTIGDVHNQVSDIWLRYNAKENYDPKHPELFVDKHFASWYPAIEKLPTAKKIAQHLFSQTKDAVYLGGVLITKIPPGGRVLPHVDKGWHPEFLNKKLYVVLQTNNGCLNRVEDEAACMQEGEVWFFDNTKEHEVVNFGIKDRITLIVCIRTEP